MNKKIYAQWILPVSNTLWREGFFGTCSNCNYTNHHTGLAPNFCEHCGATMTNSTMNEYYAEIEEETGVRICRR